MTKISTSFLSLALLFIGKRHLSTTKTITIEYKKNKLFIYIVDANNRITFILAFQWINYENPYIN